MPPVEETVRSAAPSGDASQPEAPRSGSFSGRGVLVSLLLSLAVIAIVTVATFDARALGEIPKRLNPWLLAAALATVVARVLFGAWRLDYFAGGRIGLWGGVRSQIAWDFFAYITPSTVGGGPFVAAFIAKDRRLPLGETTSIILFAMLLDQIWFALTVPALLVAGLYVEVIPASMGSVGFWAFTLFMLGLVAWVALFAYGTLIRPSVLEALIDRLLRLRWLRRFRERAGQFMADLQRRSAILRAQPASFYGKGFALTTVPWISRYLLVVLLIWSVFPDLDKPLAFLRSMALHLGSIALPTPGGAGGLEGLYALLLGPPLVPEPLVAPTLLAWRTLAFYLFIGVGGAIVAGRIGTSLRRRSARNASGNGN